MVSQDDAPDTKKQFTGLLRKTDGSPEAPSALYYRLWSCFETSSSLTTFCFAFGILVTSYQMTRGGVKKSTGFLICFCHYDWHWRGSERDAEGVGQSRGLKDLGMWVKCQDDKARQDPFQVLADFSRMSTALRAEPSIVWWSADYGGRVFLGPFMGCNLRMCPSTIDGSPSPAKAYTSSAKASNVPRLAPRVLLKGFCWCALRYLACLSATKSLSVQKPELGMPEMWAQRKLGMKHLT